jgi:iron(III) transport system substrate-binding protein
VAALATTGLAQEVNVYSSRHYDADKKLFELFTKQSGVKVNVVEGDIGPLLQRLRSEGRNSPADLLITADVGNLWRAQEAELLQPVKSAALEEVIAERLRDPAGHWFALSMRSRVIMYHKDRVKPEELSTYEALADAKWKGRILVRSSSNVYNQSLLAAMIAANGVEATEAWAKGLAANFARPPKGGDTDQIKALAAGEGDIAIANTYYLGRLVASDKAEDRAIAEKIGVFFPNQTGPNPAGRGAHVNISGAGVTKYAPNRDNGVKLLEFLVTPEAQKIFAEGNHEYPVREGVARSAVIVGFGAFKGDSVGLSQLGRHNAEAVKIADRAGWR